MQIISAETPIKKLEHTEVDQAYLRMVYLNMASDIYAYMV